MKTQKEIKKAYFDRVYAKAKIIKCACGCGEELKNKDRYGRDQKYINGHNRRKYEDPTQYKREWNHRNKQYRYDYKVKYGKDRKIELIRLKGNKCEECGIEYNGINCCIFQFHHKDPNKKEIRLNLARMGMSWEKLLKESHKCRLLCANCHFITHSSKY